MKPTQNMLKQATSGMDFLVGLVSSEVLQHASEFGYQ
jgi:hypothetical protein